MPQVLRKELKLTKRRRWHLREKVGLEFWNWREVKIVFCAGSSRGGSHRGSGGERSGETGPGPSYLTAEQGDHSSLLCPPPAGRPSSNGGWNLLPCPSWAECVMQIWVAVVFIIHVLPFVTVWMRLGWSLRVWALWFRPWSLFCSSTHLLLLVSTFISQLSFDTTYCSNLLLIVLLDRFQTSNKTTYKTEKGELNDILWLNKWENNEKKPSTI